MTIIDEIDIETMATQFEKRKSMPASSGIHDVTVVVHSDGHQDGNYGGPAHTDIHQDIGS